MVSSNYFYLIIIYLPDMSYIVPLPPKKKLDGNYTRMLQTILNESWKQHLTKQ